MGPNQTRGGVCKEAPATVYIKSRKPILWVVDNTNSYWHAEDSTNHLGDASKDETI